MAATCNLCYQAPAVVTFGSRRYCEACCLQYIKTLHATCEQAQRDEAELRTTLLSENLQLRQELSALTEALREV